MYSFTDYFDPEKRFVPYRNGQEEVEDYLRLLDMTLEGYLKFKGLGKEEKLFSRGLVITESEMSAYFEKPPYFRERDLCDPELSAAAEEAWDYIETRVYVTLNGPALPDGGEAVLSWDRSGDEEEAVKTAADAAEPEERDEAAEDPEKESITAAEEDPDGEESLTDLREENRRSFAEDLAADGDEDDFPEDSFEEGRERAAKPGILWIQTLKEMFGLDHAGVMAVIMALAAVMDRRYERIFGFLQDDVSKTLPTLGLLTALMARITARSSADQMPLRPLNEELFNSLFILRDRQAGLDAPLILNPMLQRILLGIPDREDFYPDALEVCQEEEEIPLFFEKNAGELDYVLSDGESRFCYIECSDEETVRHLLYRYCADQGDPLFVLDLRQLLKLSGEERAEALAELGLRIRLSGGRLLVRMESKAPEESGAAKEAATGRWKYLNILSRVCDGACILLFGEAEEPGELIVHSVPFLQVPMPDVSLRTEIWNYFLHDTKELTLADDISVEDLADCYDISYGMIKNACSHAKSAARVRQQRVISRELILDSLRQLNQVDFSGLANYVKSFYKWEDITITDDQRAVLKVVCDRYRLRNRVGRNWGLTRKNAYGNGVSLLLYGPPGTGKTMAAQVISSELGIPLYRVDISQIFSKYIGETEKNLSIIFDAAKGSNVILFFDEADALFSKRTEINTSNDKYANSETAYLLQKIEEYDGMSILATNHYTNFDPAFMRRITYAVRLDSPDEEARYILWTTTLPEGTPMARKINFRFLAKQFELSGSNIKAILYSAAYMAGADAKTIGAEHIVRAMEYEYRKLGRFIDREAFGPYAKYLTAAPQARVQAENMFQPSATHE